MDDDVCGSVGARVLPATAEVADDVVTVFGTRGDPARCWCQWFRLRGAEWQAAGSAQNRTALLDQLGRASAGSQPPPGVLLYRGDDVVGWAAVAPRSGYPRLLHSQVLAAASRAGVGGALDDDSVWAVTCFVVRTGHRRSGASGDLLDAAVDQAARHGARVVEGYPVDVSAKARVSSSELYHGTLSTFLERGFREVARSGPARPVVRLQLGT